MTRASTDSRYAPVISLAAVFALSQGLRVEELLRLPVRTHLKEAYGLTPKAMAAFLMVAGLTWYAKPVIGLWIDASSAHASERRCTLFAAISVLTWAAVPLCESDETLLLLSLVAINLFAAYVSTAAGGHMVKLGRATASFDRLSAVRLQATSGASVVAALLSGAFAQLWLGWVSAVGAALSAVMFGQLLRLQRRSPRDPREGWTALRELRTRPVLAVGWFMFVFHAVPGYETLLFFHQTDTLGLSEGQMGLLFGVRSIGAVVGASAFGPLRRHFAKVPLVPLGIILNGACSLLYMGYDSLGSALVIEFVATALSALTLLPLYELAAKVCPRAREAVGFGVMLSLGNLGLAISDLTGTALAERFSLSLSKIIILYAVTTSASALFLLVVPKDARCCRS